MKKENKENILTNYIIENSPQNWIFKLNEVSCNKIYCDVLMNNYLYIFESNNDQNYIDADIFKGNIFYSSKSNDNLLNEQKIINSNFKSILKKISNYENFKLSIDNINDIYIELFQNTNNLKLYSDQKFIDSLILTNEYELSINDSSATLSDIIDEYNSSIVNDPSNYLIYISIFVYNFLKLSPYKKNNLIIVFLLVRALLISNGHKIFKYVNLEDYVNQYRQDLFISFMSNDSGTFIDSCLNVIDEIYKDMAYKYHIVNGVKQNKSSRIRLTLLKSDEPINKEEIHHIWPDISYNTIELELSKLLKEGIIKKIGVTNGVKYTCKI